ncbi:phosphatidate cytidylyltransferase [Sulfodiicoccus acidiphilus]|uniref:Phosphatidate cytidylyltransferase n=1 Tax=Sulfodiicoccus acidiphilus TaxID=1670455 RepID=A0A348B3N7_9CREN|nr:phosphatidate cytidylyltransferase [Sulfodiicoccus acidiphilus]BBD72789.1 phosphatidate cytidylyltransferase [Sulfodiicoccus acidiphilus]GGT99824.1 phosphatidate cytidylyltransferase [Sulfodiicoccus acidiphilus]
MIITLNDIVWSVVFTIWVGFVVIYLSRKVETKSNQYVSRKFIHIMGGGVVAAASPLVFSSPLFPAFLSYGMMVYLVIRRIRGRLMGWFQESGDFGEITFTFSFGTLMLLLYLLNLWNDPGNTFSIGLLPILFMSFGDGVTGIVRNYVYGERKKGLWGSIAMLAVSVPMGYFLFSYFGVLAAVVATAVEAIPGLDDNFTVPFSSFAVLYLSLLLR